MSNIFVTSDNHYFHKNIMKFCPQTRPFTDIGDMTEKMILAHNRVVRPEDDVYFLGDFSFGNATQTRDVIHRLNGRLHLVYGNHDRVIECNHDIQKLFTSVQDYKFLKVGDKELAMFHYPIDGEWRNSHRGSYHIHGHLHNSTPLHQQKYRRMDVGIDTRIGTHAPYEISEVFDLLKNKEIFKHHA